MAQFNAGFSSITQFGSRALRLAIVAAAGAVLTDAASAQAFRSQALGWHVQTETRIEASSPETVRLLAGIMEIRSAVQLGLLAKQDGRPAAHLSDARMIVWPEYREGLMAAGMADLDPLLQKLDAATDKAAIAAANTEIEAALMKGHAALNPTSADVLLSLHALAEKVATQTINPSGPTDAHDYQVAWGRIMAARGELDLLMHDSDPAIAKYASEAAMAFDDVIISLPDPGRTGPVEVDPSLFNELVSRLEGLDQEA
ncbi:MAG: hypothetical protein J0L76_04205 [Rhodobacterales bacterium]|nr:hypothetical protein [Rhodobacterales bacterium]